VRGYVNDIGLLDDFPNGVEARKGSELHNRLKPRSQSFPVEVPTTLQHVEDRALSARTTVTSKYFDKMSLTTVYVASSAPPPSGHKSFVKAASLRTTYHSLSDE